jgi:L-arabinokinase
VALLVGDIPPLAFEVAAALEVPGIALGNFSWDWIYEPYVADLPEHAPLVEAMRKSYGRADLLLRLPLHAGMDVFPRIEDIPLVVRHASRDRGATRQALGLARETRPVVLVSFGGFAAVRFGSGATPDPGDFRFITFGESVPGLPADTVRLPIDHPHRHEDLVAAADAVITKPGYGTVAECLASRTPFLYTSRDDFREYELLVREIARHAHAGFLGREDLLQIRWRVALEALLSSRQRWADLRVDGADVAAERLLQLAADRWKHAGTVC